MNQPSNNHSNNLAPLYVSDFYLPKYKPGEYGDWRISIMGLGHDHGYTTGVWMVSDVPILLKRNKNLAEQWESWMALTPHEIESQELGIKYSFGHVVVMGLGLGWFAINAALSAKVTKVTVVEMDSSVIDLFNESCVLSELKEETINKITIVCDDALKWKTNNKVDFIYADIWRTLNEETALNDVRTMQNNLNANLIYYWGQELTIYNELNRNGSFEKNLSNESIEHAVTKIFELPLLIPQETDYAEMIQKVIDNRIKRGMKI